MERESLHRESRLPAKIAAALLSSLLVGLPALGQNLDNKSKDKEDKQKTESPIKHVIVLIGENRTFDHVFATYVPQSSDTISNLLSKGIIKADGTPGPNFSQAAQFQAVPPFKTDFFISLDKNEKAPYSILPQPTLNFAPTKTVIPAGTPTNVLEAIEPSLEATDEFLLTTGAASGFPQTIVLPDPDTRIDNGNARIATSRMPRAAILLAA
jgi:phospholipase C